MFQKLRQDKPFSFQLTDRVKVDQATNKGRGQRCVEATDRWNGPSWRVHLRSVRRKWRTWRIVLFVDRSSPHTARASRQLAEQRKIELRWLPAACGERNPLENLWRWLKEAVLCNHQPEDFADTVQPPLSALEELAAKQTLTKSGTLSHNCWIRT